MNKELKPCPFCGGEVIDYSIKTTGRRKERKYHVAMYCKECNCYGARTLITATEETRWGVENNEEYKELAIESWNTRKPIDKVVEQIKEYFKGEIDTCMEEIHIDYILEHNKAVCEIVEKGGGEHDD